MFEFKTTEIAFLDPDPERTTFTETFVWEPTTTAESRLGRLYLVGQILSSHNRESNAGLLAKLADLIKNEYYRNPDRRALDSFRLALSKANSSLDREAKANIAVAAITADTLVTASLGEGMTLVFRDGTLTDLKTKTANSFSGIVHGSIKLGDVVILATPQLHRLGPERLRQLAGTEKLAAFLKEKETEFKNLGLITVSCRRKLAATLVPPILSRPKRIPSFAGRRLVQFTALGAVIVLTVAALVFERSTAQKERAASEILASISRFKTETAELLKIGNFGEAEQLFNEWQFYIQQLDDLKVKNEEADRARKEINEIKPLVLRYEMISPREVINFEKNAVGFSPDGLVPLKDGLLLFNASSLYNFNLKTKIGGFTFVPSELLIKDALALPNTIAILTNDAILEYNQDEIGRLAAITEPVFRLEFYNDAVYALSKSAVWVLREGKLAPWFRTNSEISNARDFAIDGFIYVLEDAVVTRFLNGEKKGEFKVDAGSERVYTESSFRNIYLLNPESGTIQIVEKSSLSSSRRLEHQSLKNAHGIAVSKDEKTLYFLSGERVFAISL